MGWKINNDICIRCGGCVSVCPFGALELKDDIMFNEKLCNLCGICEKACPISAIKVRKNG